MRKLVTLIATLAACTLLTYWLWSPEGTPGEAEEEEHHHHEDVVHFTAEQLKTHGITMEKAAPGSLQEVIRAPAKIIIAADQIAHILPKASGIVLTAHKNLGELVAPNDILATLESKEMAETKALYLTSLKKEELAANVYMREKSLYEKKLTSTQEFNAIENTLESAKIDLQLARQKLLSLGLAAQEIDQLAASDLQDFRIYEIRTPMAGRIIARHITPGELVNSDREVYVIANLDKVWAEISVFSQDRPYVKQEQPVKLTTNDGQIAQAKVVYLSPIVDEHTRTSKAIAEIDNSSGFWLPGTFVQAQLIAQEYAVPLRIPKEAIQNIDNENTVFVSIPDGFAVRPITIGRSDETHCEVLNGLNHGETVATKNTFLLKAELQKEEAEHMD